MDEKCRSYLALALGEELEAAAREARDLCPRDTGRLRASIEASVYPYAQGVKGELRARTPYAAAVEMGGGKRAPQPFLYPAYKMHAQQIRLSIARALMRAIEEELT